MKLSFPWLKNAGFDLSFILLPSILSVVLTFVFARSLDQTQSIPMWAWVVFVLGVDVSHVYSTLFRTYFNSNEFKENRLLLTGIPVFTWMIGVFLYSAGPLVFWRVLAYVAVFHFIRQQYGFLRLYSKADKDSSSLRKLDALLLYSATLYPVLFWHTHQPRNFHWFVDGDFITGLPVFLSWAMGWIYVALLGIYIFKEFKQMLSGIPVNVPKNLIILGTALSWYFGIVFFNGDMIFTITNIIAHGLPYMALVWLYGERQKEKGDAPLILNRFDYKVFFSRFSLPLFLGVLLTLSYLEEGLWAGLVWREHLSVFGIFSKLPAMTAKDTLTWLVPLLTLPQATHYVLDGFIWKIKDSGANWQKVLFSGDRSGYG